MSRVLLLLAAIVLCYPAISDARLTRLVVTNTEPLAGGVSWGNSGPYERLTGTAYFEQLEKKAAGLRSGRSGRQRNAPPPAE